MSKVQAIKKDLPRDPVIDPEALELLIDNHLEDLDRAVKEHMEAVNDAFFESEESGDVSIDVPSFGLYDGCDVCVQREILIAFCKKLSEIAHSTIAEIPK